MKTRTVDQQLAMLRPGLRFAAHLHHGMMGVALVGMLAALVFWHPVPLLLALFFGLVGISERTAGPNIVAALHAYDAETSMNGVVENSIHRRDGDDTFHARLSQPGNMDWTFQFIPQGWCPTAGIHEARAWRHAENGRPLLVTTKVGVLIPRYTPEPASTPPVNGASAGSRPIENALEHHLSPTNRTDQTC